MRYLLRHGAAFEILFVTLMVAGCEVDPARTSPEPGTEAEQAEQTSNEVPAEQANDAARQFKSAALSPAAIKSRALLRKAQKVEVAAVPAVTDSATGQASVTLRGAQ